MRTEPSCAEMQLTDQPAAVGKGHLQKYPVFFAPIAWRFNSRRWRCDKWGRVRLSNKSSSAKSKGISSSSAGESSIGGGDWGLVDIRGVVIGSHHLLITVTIVAYWVKLKWIIWFTKRNFCKLLYWSLEIILLQGSWTFLQLCVTVNTDWLSHEAIQCSLLGQT